MSEITLLLQRMHAGDAAARSALFAAAYNELCRLARTKLHLGGRNAMLETASLVHECYMRDARAGELRAINRQGFFCYASRIMQSVILDEVRRQRTQRRGANVPHITMCDEIASSLADDEATARRVHEALEVLQESEAPLGQVILLRYFGGYTEPEIAKTLGVTERTVQRHCKKGRLLLKEILKQ
jgi:RNA polymerase sigma factor (TIGR02999 family)